jgi:hypothetical protein
MTTHRITNANDVRSGNALPGNRAVLGVPMKNLVHEALLNASGNPVVAAHTNTTGVFATPFIAASQAVAGAGYLTINGSWATGGVATVDWPRTIALASSNAGDTTQTALITGTDVWGEVMSQLVDLNGENTVATLKAFYEVTSIYISATLAGDITVDVGNAFGLSYKPTRNGLIKVSTVSMSSGVIGTTGPLQDYPWYASGSTGTTGGTFLQGDQTSPATTATGDVRGTYLPHATINGATNNGLVFGLLYEAANGPDNSDGFGQTQV